MERLDCFSFDLKFGDFREEDKAKTLSLYVLTRVNGKSRQLKSTANLQSFL